MKKFFSLVLALVMALSLTTIAWGTSYDCTGTCSDPTTHVAAVGTTHYDDLQEAIDAAEVNGGTVTLLQSVTLSTYPSRNYWLAIEAPITFDGNGKTLTYNASTYNFRVFNIDTTGNVEIKNLTVSTTGERGFNVINKAVNLTLTNVNATAANYTLNVTESAGAAKIALNNCTLTGLCTVNVWGAGSEVTISGGKIVCNDPNSNPYPAGESYSALVLNSTAAGATITADNTVVFDIKHDSNIASNATTDGEILIAGSNSGVAVMVAAIEFTGGYAYTFTSVQDAIDFAVAEMNAGGVGVADVEIVVLDTAINSGESFTPVDGVDLVLPAGADAELVTLPNGEVAVVTPATFSGTTAITSSFKEDGTYYVLYNGIWDEVTYVPAEDNGDGTGNVAYFEGDLANYIICKKNDDDAMKLTSGFLAGDKLLNYVKVSEVEYEATATAVNASLYATCTTDINAKGYKVVDAYGAVTYYKDPATGVIPTNWLLVGKEIKGVVPQVEVTDYVMGGHALIQNKAAAKDEAKTVFEYKCVICGTIFDGTKTKTAGVTYTNYFMPNAATKAAYTTAGYDMSDVDTGDLYLISKKPVGGSSVGTTTTDKVTSAATFDAGIAMYVGMSVMAAAGSVVVLKKRED